MKYAILGPQKGINRVLDTEPSHQLLDGVTVEQITDEQATTVQAGRTSDPRVLYFLINGELKTLQQKTEAERSVRQAERETARVAALAAKAAAMSQADRIKAAEAHIARHFTAFGLMEGLKKLMTAQMSGNLAAVPKTVAVATWVETVKAMAMAGQLDLPEPPHTFDEIVAE